MRHGVESKSEGDAAWHNTSVIFGRRGVKYATPGSIAVELASHDALVGDLVASGILIGGVAFTGHAIRPPFEDDPARVSCELDGLVHRGATRFHMGHGGPLGATEVMRHARALRKAQQHRCVPGACNIPAV